MKPTDIWSSERPKRILTLKVPCRSHRCLPSDFFFPFSRSRHSRRDTDASPFRPPAEFIPPNPEPYQYIIFRAAEVKDLAVDEQTVQRSVHEDPAVMGVSHARSDSYTIHDETFTDVNTLSPRAQNRVEISVAFLLIVLCLICLSE
jgi:hypothetical protein